MSDLEKNNLNFETKVHRLFKFEIQKREKFISLLLTNFQIDSTNSLHPGY